MIQKREKLKFWGCRLTVSSSSEIASSKASWLIAFTFFMCPAISTSIFYKTIMSVIILFQTKESLQLIYLNLEIAPVNLPFQVLRITAFPLLCFWILCPLRLLLFHHVKVEQLTWYTSSFSNTRARRWLRWAVYERTFRGPSERSTLVNSYFLPSEIVF